MFDFTKPQVRTFAFEGKEILLVVTDGCREPDSRTFFTLDADGKEVKHMNAYESFVSGSGGGMAGRNNWDTSRMLSRLMPPDAGDAICWKADYFVCLATDLIKKLGAEGAKSVFYHEIGHIVHGDVDGVDPGEDVEKYIAQETKADAFAALHCGKAAVQKALLSLYKTGAAGKIQGGFYSYVSKSDRPMARIIRARLLNF